MKKTPKTFRRRRTTTRNRAPLGLRAIFDALQPGGFRHAFGTTPVDPFASVPHAWLTAAQHEDADRRCLKLLHAVANRYAPGAGFGPDGDQRASECIEVLPIAAFWAGVATCWHVMNAINGGQGGAR